MINSIAYELLILGAKEKYNTKDSTKNHGCHFPLKRVIVSDTDNFFLQILSNMTYNKGVRLDDEKSVFWVQYHTKLMEKKQHDDITSLLKQTFTQKKRVDYN